MPTCYWRPNAAFVAQVDVITLTAVAAGGVLSATINGKSVSYVVQAGDTTTTAAAAWQALLANTAVVPPEFAEIIWTVLGGVITATAATPGTPFTLTATASGAGTSLTQNHPQPNVSPSDVGNPSNWSRNGVSLLPQSGDDVLVADSATPMLWSLSALAGVQLASFTRWQTMTGQIGLATVNPAGYLEYRPVNLQLTGQPASSPSGGSSSPGPGGSGVLNVTLGLGRSGSGPPFEQYDFQTGQAKVTVLGGQSVAWIGTSLLNVLTVVGAAVAVAPLAGQVAALASATVDGGGSLTLGPGVTVAGAVTLTGASLVSMAAPASIVAQAGSTVVMNTSQAGLVVGVLKAVGNSSVSWLSDAAVTTLTLGTGSSFDASGDVRPMTVTNTTLDGDSCRLTDPNNRVTFTNPITVSNNVQSGPLQWGFGPRTVKLV